MTTIDGTVRAGAAQSDFQSTEGPVDLGATSILPSPMARLEASGDLGAILAALTIEGATKQKEVADESRDASEACEEHEEAAQVAELHNKAGNVFAQGLTTGLFQATAGVCGVVSGGNLMNKPASGPVFDLAKAKGALWEAASKFQEAQGTAFGKGFESLEVADDARAKQHEQTATHARRGADDYRAASDGAKKLIDKALEFYKEYQAGRDQTMAAATHRA